MHLHRGASLDWDKVYSGQQQVIICPEYVILVTNTYKAFPWYQMHLVPRWELKQAFLPQADFSKIARTEPLYISDVRQNLSISIDEKGCEAEAYTEISLMGSAPY